MDLFEPEIAPLDPPSPLQRYGHSRILGHMEPPFGGRRGRRGSAITPLERVMVVSYRLSIVTVALSVTSAAICDRMSQMLKSTGGGSLWAQISGCSPWSRPVMCSNLRDHNPKTPQTDREMTCNRKTAFCTIVHRAVKNRLSKQRKIKQNKKENKIEGMRQRVNRQGDKGKE